MPQPDQSSQFPFVLKPSGACLSDDCLSDADDIANFIGVKGHTYYLVVDGFNGSASDYTLSVPCDPFPYSIYLPVLRRD